MTKYFVIGICCPAPPNFPLSVEIVEEDFSNWAGTIRSGFVWVASPATPTDVVLIVNWANENGYKIRPVGFGLGWSPLAVSPSNSCQNVIAVRTSDKLTEIEMLPGSPAILAVKAQTGASMDDLTSFLGKRGYALNSHHPSAGHVTVGGVISGGGHGTGVPANNETPAPGFTFGSVSNLVLSLTAVVFDNATSSYALKTFERNDAESNAMIVNLGRAFIVDVTLSIGRDYNLQCYSYVDIPVGELYKDPSSVTRWDRTFASLIQSSGRVSSIWFAFTTNPWIRIWNVKPTKPLFSRLVTKPYSYVFSDTVGSNVSLIISQILNGAPWLAPGLGNAESLAVTAGLLATSTFDLWGTSANTLRYVKPTTLRITVNGYAIHTKRENVQRIVNTYTTFFFNLIQTYKSQGLYPVNIGHEIRLTGNDYSLDAEAPSLSPSTPFLNHPEFDVILWVDTITLPGNPYVEAFGKDLETFLFNNFPPNLAIVRPEWSKGWGFNGTAGWANLDVIQNKIPGLYPEWEVARSTLNKYDPNRVFTNDLLDILLP